MKEFKILKFLDKYKGLYEKFGVDYEKMRLILKIKLTMDERRVPTIMQNNNVKKEEKNIFFKSLFFYAFMGLFIGVLTFFPINKMYVYTMVFAMFMFIILTVFISDFSSVLLDLRDKNLIATRGVSDKTINAAKITHICYYVISIALSIGWLAIIGSFKSGILTGIVFLLELIVISIFMIVITALLYFLVLRFFNGEMVKDIINYVQIILSIFMAVGYQFVGRVFELVDLNIVYKEKIWHLFFPPIWFSALINLIEAGNLSTLRTLLIANACLIPAISIIIYIRKSSKFEVYLAKLNNNDSKEKEKKKSILFKLGKLFCKSNSELACYSLTSSIMKREREFKLKVYPSLGFTIVFPLLFMLIFSQGDMKEIRFYDFNIIAYLNIYLFALMIPSIMIMLQYSQFYKAAWIYKSTPLIDKGDIFKGCYKAFLFNLLMPIYLIESIIFILLFKTKVIIHLLITLLFIAALIPMTHKINKFTVPFSQEFNVVNRSSSILNVFLGIFLVGAGAIIHGIFAMKTVLIIMYGIVLIASNFFVWRSLKGNFN